VKRLITASVGAVCLGAQAVYPSTAQAQCSTPCRVSIDLVMGKLGNAIANPDAGFFSTASSAGNPVYFLMNLRTLSRKATRAKYVAIEVDSRSEIAQFVFGVQQLKWDIVMSYLGDVAAQKAPQLAKVIGTTGTVAFSLLTPTTVGYGQSFEFCRTGEKLKDAGPYVLHLLQTYEPARFAAIAERDGCAEAMLGYVMAR